MPLATMSSRGPRPTRASKSNEQARFSTPHDIGERRLEIHLVLAGAGEELLFEGDIRWGLTGGEWPSRVDG